MNVGHNQAFPLHSYMQRSRAQSRQSLSVLQGQCPVAAPSGTALLAFLHSLDHDALARISTSSDDAAMDTFRVLAERLVSDLVRQVLSCLHGHL